MGEIIYIHIAKLKVEGQMDFYCTVYGGDTSYRSNAMVDE